MISDVTTILQTIQIPTMQEPEEYKLLDKIQSEFKHLLHMVKLILTFAIYHCNNFARQNPQKQNWCKNIYIYRVQH